MTRYVNSIGTLAVLGRGEDLKVVITNVSTGVAIQAGALANEEQTEAEYMAMHGFEPLGEVEITRGYKPLDYDQAVQFNVASSSFRVPLDTDGASDKKHWSVELAEAMEEKVLADAELMKVTARVNQANMALKRAQDNAENSILGTDT